MSKLKDNMVVKLLVAIVIGIILGSIVGEGAIGILKIGRASCRERV